MGRHAGAKRQVWWIVEEAHVRFFLFPPALPQLTPQNAKTDQLLIVVTENRDASGSIVSIQPAFEEKLARRATVMSKNRARHQMHDGPPLQRCAKSYLQFFTLSFSSSASSKMDTHNNAALK